MKTKFMAFILAAGLGITGIAVTAQAAEPEPTPTPTPKPEDPCRHETMQYFENFQRAVYYSPTYHISVYLTGYICSNCSYYTMIEEKEYYEQHDYEQTYYSDGTVKSECLGCHDSYIW